MMLMIDSLVEVDTITGSHGKVGQEGECGNEGSQDVEKPLLLLIVSIPVNTFDGSKRHTTGTRKAMI